jgi:hypothetical protein
VLNHPIFGAVSELVRGGGIERMEFWEAKDLIGRSLREDYSVLE